MSDLHIVSLTYEVITPEGLDYSKAETLEYDFDEVFLIISDGKLVIKPKQHFKSLEEAKIKLSGFLKSWEVHAALESNSPQISFRYLDCKIIDRSSPENGYQLKLEPGQYKLNGGLGVIATVGKTKYPHPPLSFELTPHSATLWRRYQGYLEDRERLPAMAYACLSFCENKVSTSRKDFGNEYKISQTVLNKIGNLSSRRGEEGEARKFKNPSASKPLTYEEIKWIETAIKSIIIRLSDKREIASLPQITMGDLPPIN